MEHNFGKRIFVASLQIFVLLSLFEGQNLHSVPFTFLCAAVEGSFEIVPKFYFFSFLIFTTILPASYVLDFICNFISEFPTLSLFVSLFQFGFTAVNKHVFVPRT